MERGHAGADVVSFDTNPIVERQTLKQCMERCEAEPACSAIAMQDTTDNHSPTCWLRANVTLAVCSHDWRDFNMFFRPEGGSPVPKYGLETAPNQFITYPSMNCFLGSGADYAVPDQDFLGGHMDQASCEAACLNTPNCEGIVLHDTRDASRPTCHLRSNIVMGDCRTDEEYFNLVVLHRGPWGVAGNSSSTSSGPLSSTPGPTSSTPGPTSSASTTPTAPDLGNSSAAPTTTSSSTSGSGNESSGSNTSTTSSAPGFPTAWASMSSTNCYIGRGAQSLIAPDLDPVPQHQSMEGCKRLCMEQATCQGLVMDDDGNGDNPNCWLRRDIELANCEKVHNYNIWLKPASGVKGKFDWYGLSGLRCDPGFGANDARPGGGAVPQHLQLGNCEDECTKISDCEAVMWYDSKDGYTPNCFLRKDLDLTACVVDPETNMRVRSANLPDEYKPKEPEEFWKKSNGPWKVVVASLCDAGGGSPVSVPGYDPMQGHMSLNDCEKGCLGEVDCMGIMMKDTKNGVDDNCWLRADVQISQCEADDLFTMWLKPVATSSAAADPEWYSFAGKNCHPGKGGDLVVEGEHAYPSRLTTKECQEVCDTTDGCEGVVWHDTKDATTPNCHLRKNIDISKCDDIPAFDLRIKPQFATTALKLDPTGGSPSGNSGINAAGLADEAWPTQSATNCFKGKGAENLVEVDLDPVHGHKLLKECVWECAQRSECEGIIMHDTQGNHDNCWLRKNLDLDACETGDQVDRFTLWVKPTSPVAEPGMWMSHPGINCFPGSGAEYAIPGQDVLPQHLALQDCEAQCQTTTGCEGIIWHDTMDGNRYNCYLRKNIFIDECREESAFNLRLKGPSQPGRLFLTHRERSILPTKVVVPSTTWYMVGLCFAMVPLASFARNRFQAKDAQRRVVLFGTDEGSESDSPAMDSQDRLIRH